jgi:predicted AAA+ superfamily ATPase
MSTPPDLLKRLERLLERAEHWLPPPPGDIDWKAPAFRWRSRSGVLAHGWLEPVYHPHRIRLGDLQGVDGQKQRIEQNTRQFVAGHPANNVLLTGARGTGKSSLVKAVLERFSAQGLRLIEVDKADLVHLPDIVALIVDRPEKSSFLRRPLIRSGRAGLQGTQERARRLDQWHGRQCAGLCHLEPRHLMPEMMAENLEAQQDERGELRPGDTTEEKVSLSERFGLWLSFYTMDQDTYLAICNHWLGEYGVAPEQIDAVRARPCAGRSPVALARGAWPGSLRVIWPGGRVNENIPWCFGACFGPARGTVAGRPVGASLRALRYRFL